MERTHNIYFTTLWYIPMPEIPYKNEVKTIKQKVASEDIAKELLKNHKKLKL